MILTSPPLSKDQTNNKEKDNTTQNSKKQIDVCPNAAVMYLYFNAVKIQ